MRVFRGIQVATVSLENKNVASWEAIHSIWAMGVAKRDFLKLVFCARFPFLERLLPITLLTTALFEQWHCCPQMFNPPLPRDVLIDSFLDHGEICIEATIMCECSGFQSCKWA